MKTTVIAGKPIASFDNQVMTIIGGQETTMRQVEKEHFRIGIRNENNQLYRAIGVPNADLFTELLEQLEDIGFIDELEEEPAKNGYDAILRK